MHLACSHCGARYRLPADKVSGRDFRFRCKRCGEVVTVRAADGEGPAPAAHGDEAKVASPTSGQSASGPDRQRNWYAIQDGVQLGPIRLEELLQLISTGRLSARNFVWHQSLPEWRRVAEVPALAPSLSAGAPPSASPEIKASPAPEKAKPARRDRGEMKDSVVAALAEVHQTLTQMPAVPPSLTRQLAKASDEAPPAPKPAATAATTTPAKPEGQNDRSSTLADELLHEALLQASGVHSLPEATPEEPDDAERLGFFDGEQDAALDNTVAPGGGAIPAALQESGFHPGTHSDLFRAEERRRRLRFALLLLALLGAVAAAAWFWLNREETTPGSPAPIGQTAPRVARPAAPSASERPVPLGEEPGGTMKTDDDDELDLSVVDLAEEEGGARAVRPAAREAASASAESAAAVATRATTTDDEKGEVPIAREAIRGESPDAGQQISRLLELQIRSFSRCNQGGPELRVTISGTVARDGRVTDVTVVDDPSSLRSPRLRRCVRRIVDSWHLLPQDEPQSFRKTLVLSGE